MKLFPWNYRDPSYTTGLVSLRNGTRILLPALEAHVLLHGLPDIFHNLTIAPPCRRPSTRIVFINLRTQYTSSPAFDRLGQVIAAPAHVDAERVAEELRRLLPLVAFKLPDLACGKDGDDARPILGLELFGRLDDDEAHGASGVDCRQEARDV